MSVLDDIVAERARQDAKWGQQDHPNGTGGDARLYGIGFQAWADLIRAAVDQASREGRTEWAGVLLEEVFEALAEDGPLALRNELVQVAAVATQWIEAIDRREAGHA